MLTDTIKNNTFFRRLLFLGILIAVGVVIIDQLGFFVGSFLGATTIYVVVRKAAFLLIEQRRWRPWLASLSIVTAALAVLSGAGYFIFTIIASEIPTIDTSSLMKAFNDFIQHTSSRMGIEILPEHLVKSTSGILSDAISTILNSTYSFAANMFMMLIILYFMLTHGREMEHRLFMYIPFRQESLKIIKRDTRNIIFSNAIGIPIVMLFQGLVAALVYWLLGINNFAFWAFLTALCGLIPMVGTTIVTVPMGIFFIASGAVWQGVILLVCALAIIANIDNLVRIVMMKQIADTHPLVIIFGVILGIPLFGFWGIIFGPLLLSMFLLLIKIYYTEYGLFSNNDSSTE